VPAVTPLVTPEQLEPFRRELTGYCYRMLGSGFEADDAVQETMVRAWKAGDRFEGRSTVRSWLFRIATNVCLDLIRSRQRRAVPMSVQAPSAPDPANLGTPLAESAWVSPIADDRVLPDTADPAELAESRETIRLAFIAALQRLPARQRAALILCEVLRWQATEAAALLETTVPAINSALQRARTTLAAAQSEMPGEAGVTGEQTALIDRYVEAFERYDVETLVTLLREDATQDMPPFPMWLRGAGDIVAWMLGGGAGCRGSRMLPTRANGCPAFGQYRRDPAGGHLPWAIVVLEQQGGLISGIHSFVLTPALFPAFGLPTSLPA
jgi:RNA polymerase sigma-70 factor (ECF subfamily)